jgi:hypothetical protein
LFTGKMIVSKNYFEKYICQQMSEFIVFDAFISSEWYYVVDM